MQTFPQEEDKQQPQMDHARPDQSSRTSSRSLVKSMKCGICWEYFRKPHTLRCGHSFCIKCLRKLLRVRNEDVIDDLMFPSSRFPCPSCRQPCAAGHVLKKRASVSYSLQEVVEHWVKERKKLRQNSWITVRSVASQSDPVNGSEEEDLSQSDISIEETSSVRTRLSPSCFTDSDGENENITNEKCDEISDNSSDDSYTTTLDDNDDFDYHIGQILIFEPNRQFRHRQVQDGLRAIYYEIFATFREVFCNSSRSIMALIWCGYTFSIMIIANGFFPYMALYSLLFLLILYAETLEQRRR